MPHKRTATNLSLESFEGTASHSILLRLSADQIEAVTNTGALALGHKTQDVHIWKQMLVGDLVLCFTIGENSRFLACRVSGKGIVPPSPMDPLRIKEEKPFRLILQVVGRTENFKIRNEAFRFIESHEIPPRHVFQKLWEQCRPYQPPHVDGTHGQVLASSGRNGYEIRIASSREDFVYMSQMAAYHPFGSRRAFLSLLAFYQGKPAGAVLVDRGKDTQLSHRAAWRVFRRDYPWIKARSVDIVRLYSSPKAPSKFSLHRALLEATLKIAPALVEQPLSLVDGMSYSYHPLAWEFAFQVELPQKLEDSFYYWRTFNVPSPAPNLTLLEISQKKSRIRKLIRTRREVKYWFAYGRPEDIETGTKKRMWGIRKQHPNTGRWSALQPGNIVFFLTRDQRIRSYGRVESKEIKKINNYEHFPLLISFARPMVTELDIDVSGHAEETWFRKIEAGGIVPLPDEFGATIKSLADEQRKDGKMWVEPNPYILHKTDFDVIHGQIFVVQAWDLRDTVYPMIKRILETENYKVTYSGDRDGQLVFEDIWLMVNESEAILVDFTLRRPNVYLEYGMALVLGKYYHRYYTI